MVKARSTTKKTNPSSASKPTELRIATARDQTATRELRLHRANRASHVFQPAPEEPTGHRPSHSSCPCREKDRGPSRASPPPSRSVAKARDPAIGRPNLATATLFDEMSTENNMVAEVGSKSDRISDLPDVLLQHVLCFLQTKQVVRTCVLARRLRHIWKSMPILHVTDAHMFMDHLQLLRDRSPLEACMFGFRVFTGDHISIVNEWIRSVTVHGKFLDFSSCPALEELEMTRCVISGDKISSSSLKRLSIWECEFKSNVRTRISAPSLSFLELIDVKGRTPFLEDMPVLVTAKVVLSGTKCRDYCHSMNHGYCTRCVLLKGLADATNLEFIADPEVFILKRDLRWCPTFTKLKTLSLISWFESAEYCTLIWILQHSPFLEKLTLQLSKKPDISVQSIAIYDFMEKPFASENLKTVEVKYQDIDQRVHKLIKSLNRHGIPLEKISIQQTNRSVNH
uniref:F-box domain-containing protein n=1 Tax=Leersia perrieri TaxID=77586 RepID=A0A0D9XQ47_9ORYZ